MWKRSWINRGISGLQRNFLIEHHPGWYAVQVRMGSRRTLIGIIQQDILGAGAFRLDGGVGFKLAGDKQCLLLIESRCLISVSKGNTFGSKGRYLRSRPRSGGNTANRQPG